MRRLFGDVLTIENDATACERLQAGDGVEECCLSSTIRTDQCGNTARFNGNRNIVECDVSSETDLTEEVSSRDTGGLLSDGSCRRNYNAFKIESVIHFRKVF